MADPALVPLYFVAKKAAEHVTVVLSGEGADEFFGGYTIYREPLSLAGVNGLPTPLQRGLRAVSKAIPEGVKGKSFLERGTTPLEERYYGNARIFTEEDKQQLLRRYDPTVRYTDVTAPLYAEAADLDDVTTMQYIDVYTWLRGDILVKADRMSMAHSLELRVPFLDKEVFEVAAGDPGRPQAAAAVGRDQVRAAPRPRGRGAAGDRQPQEARLPHADPGLAQGRDVRVGPRHPGRLGRRTSCSTCRTRVNLLDAHRRGDGGQLARGLDRADLLHLARHLRRALAGPGHHAQPVRAAHQARRRPAPVDHELRIAPTASHPRVDHDLEVMIDAVLRRQAHDHGDLGERVGPRVAAGSR